ncbi:MAG: type 1 glutamine amidotransferase domain-containing protein [Gammaproteobacteria bacterium]|nr:type 1 glutamine amidotransferase domain-containing protein [Gammaproteobacteria bacterium]
MYKLIALIFCFTVAFPAYADDVSKKKVLIIASNLIDMGDPEKHEARNNLLEFAPPYHVFLSHGYDVDFASPDGGEVAFFMDPIGISSYAIKYEGFLDKARNSLAPGDINSEEYGAVYFGGGYGPLFDVAADEDLLNIIAEIYENGGVIGGSGHGSGGFANVKLSNGEFMVKGKRVAGFPNSTEKSKPWAKQGTLLPFLIEDRLRENGAIALNKESVKDKHDVIVDQRIVSTMFLPSAALVAKEMIDILEK